MWQLSIVSLLILSSFVLAASQPSPVRNKCGQSKPLTTFPIEEGNNQSRVGEFPWTVLIWSTIQTDFMGEINHPEGYCTGALIHEMAVLTTARCVKKYNKSPITIGAGTWDTSLRIKTLPDQERHVKKIIYHELFDQNNFHHDYCLLILDTPVNRSANVDVVCLPDTRDTAIANRCIVNGWGEIRPNIMLSMGALYYALIPRKVELPIVNASDCKQSFDMYGVNITADVASTSMCAGGEGGRDACKGYEGAPLVCPVRGDPSRYIQVGMFLKNPDCGHKGFPGIYAKVAPARQWINNTLAANGLDTTGYQYSP